MEKDKFCRKIKIDVFGVWLRMEGGKLKIKFEYVEDVFGFILDEVKALVDVWEVVDWMDIFNLCWYWLDIV